MAAAARRSRGAPAASLPRHYTVGHAAIPRRRRLKPVGRKASPEFGHELNCSAGRSPLVSGLLYASAGTSPAVVPSGACRAWFGSLPLHPHRPNRTLTPGLRPALRPCWREVEGCPGAGKAPGSPACPSTTPSRSPAHLALAVSQWQRLLRRSPMGWSCFAPETLPARAFCLCRWAAASMAGTSNQVEPPTTAANSSSTAWE